jgi:hypothetical protein
MLHHSCSTAYQVYRRVKQGGDNAYNPANRKQYRRGSNPFGSSIIHHARRWPHFNSIISNGQKTLSAGSNL